MTLRAIVLTGLFCCIASADTVLLTLDPNFPTDYEFYSYTDTAGQAQSDIPVAPYITTLSGGSYNNALAYTFCYDLESPTSVGSAYPGTLEFLTDTATLESTYLLNQLNEDGLMNASLAVRGAISLAIWQIMNPSSDTGVANFPADPAAQPYITSAVNAVATGAWNAADSALYPTWVPNDPSIQRFGVVMNGETPAPEPATVVIVGMVLIVLSYRRRTASRPLR